MSTTDDEADAFADEVAAELLAGVQRRNQAEIAEQWGPDFTSMLVDSYAFCPSPDGAIVGIQFTLKSGETNRASLPVWWFVQFHLELQLALETASERMGDAGPGGRH